MSKNKFVKQDGLWNFTFENGQDFLYTIPSLNFIVLELLKDYNSTSENHYRDIVIKGIKVAIKQ